MLFSLTMCEKDQSYCWECFIMDNYTNVVISKECYNDLTLEEIDILMQEKTIPGTTHSICYKR